MHWRHCARVSPHPQVIFHTLMRNTPLPFPPSVELLQGLHLDFTSLGTCTASPPPSPGHPEDSTL